MHTAPPEEQLRVSYLALMAVSQGVLIAGPDRKIRFVNDAFATMTGYTKDEIHGHDCRLLQGPLTNAATKEAIRTALREVREFAGEILNYRKDGTIFWNELSISPVRDEQGRLTHFIGVTRDITSRKQTEANLKAAWREVENQKFALDQHAIVAVTDLHGDITYVNDKFCAISGYAREELLGRNHRLVNSGIHPKAFFAELWATISQSRVWHGDICNRAKNGSLYWVQSTMAPLLGPEGKPQAYIAIRTDITTTKMAEARLAQAKDHAEELNNELEHRIGQANELAIKAERASEVKGMFVANMSHEIRTPMNGIMGMIEVLLGTDLTPEQEDFARTAYRSTEALMTIINDVLDFSKLEAHKLELEHCEFDLHELVFQVAELFRSQLAGRPLEMLVRIANEVPRLALGDPGRVRQILANLVGNAVKFTKAGFIRIDVTWVERTFVLAVSDTGIGIPRDLIGRLFTAFTQVDASYSRSFGGTGLGLALSRRFADLMHGTLTVESEAGRGSTFTAKLPLALPIAALHAQTTDRGMSVFLEQPRILVVDDSESSSQIIREMLAELGARPTVCANGVRALELLRGAVTAGEPFSAAIIDLRLRGMDGVGVAREIRRVQTLARLPLLMLTGAGQPEDSTQLEQAGFNGFLVKPVRFQEFTQVLELTIKSCRAGRPGLVTRYSLLEKDSQSKPKRPEIDADVLLVEDHEVNRKIAVVALGKLGARVAVAENGRVAVDMVLAHRYDIVLMDCQMPVMDGYEATQSIRNHEQLTGGRRLPIVAMTANAMPGSRERCLAAGMDDYLAKPFRIQQLEDLIRQWVHGASTTQTGPAQSADNQEKGYRPMIDMAILREVERTDAGMAIIILKAFHANLARDLASITGHLITGHLPDLDFHVINRSAHKIKGSSGSIGALELQAIAGDLEAAALAKDAAACRRLAAALEQAASTFLTATATNQFAASLTSEIPTR